jgi:4-carboxymuconolactone decarboxylase
MDEKDAHETLRAEGRAAMHEILGAEYMARRDASTSEFNAPLRALSEEFAYGTLWARPGLGRRERSLVTLGMLCALNRPHEIRMHVRAALANGVTVAEISETLTHAAAYCGLPAAIDALAVAEQVLKEAGRR